MTLRAGIIGTGIIAAEHASSIAMIPQGISLVAAFDADSRRLENFCKTFGVERKLPPAALIADPDIDLVVVATPPFAHEEFVVAALEEGKYVLCEKPVTHTIAGAHRILEADARHPGKCSVGYQLRYDLQHRRLKWICENHWIGNIQNAVIEHHQIIPHVGRDVDKWWGAWETAGGGVVLTQVIHKLDLLIRIMGRPLSVKASMDTRYTGIASEDYAEISIEFENGCHADCIASVESGYRGSCFEVRGSMGTVSMPWKLALRELGRESRAREEMERALPDPKLCALSFMDRVKSRLGQEMSAEPRILTPHAELYMEIAASMQRGSPLPIPPKDAFRSLELCMAAYESAISGKTVPLPLAKNALVYKGVKQSEYDVRQYTRSKVRTLMSFAEPPAQRQPPKKTLSRSIGTLGFIAARSFYRAAMYGPRMVKAWMRPPVVLRGGPQTRIRPWPSRQNFDQRERRAVMRVVDRQIKNGNAMVYDGIEEKAYCEAFSTYLGGGYADAVNSGTNALYIALRVLDLEPGSEVIVPPATDPGGMMPVAMNMCIPIPADSAPGSVITSAEQIAKALTRRTSAIVVAHIGGYPLDMDPIMRLARQGGIPVVEDCAQSHGARYKGRMVGTFGAISAFSTMYGKHHCTGSQGGVVFTRDPLLFAQVKRIADRGKAFGVTGSPGNLFASLNFNQDELSMAIGRVQLQKLPDFVRARRKFVDLVHNGLRDLDCVTVVADPPDSISTYYFMLFRIDLGKLSCGSEEFATAMKEEGIGNVSAGYTVVPTDHPWHRGGVVFAQSGLPWSLNQVRPQHFELPNLRAANRAIIRVDMHEQLGPEEALDLVSATKKVARYFRIHQQVSAVAV